MRTGRKDIVADSVYEQVSPISLIAGGTTRVPVIPERVTS